MRLQWLLLAASLVMAASCSRPQEKGVVVNKAFRTVISKSTTVLAGFNLQDLRKSDFYKAHATELNRLWPDGSRIGVDARRDVRFLGFAWNGEQGIVFAEGKFDRKRLESKLKEQGGQSSKVAEYTVIGNQANAVAFLSDQAVLAGPMPALKSAIDTQENGVGEVPEMLAEQLRSLPPKDEIWVVTRGGVPLGGLPFRSDMLANLANFTTAISFITVGLSVDSGSHLQGTVGCISPDGATRVHDAFRGLIGLARLSTKDNQVDLLKLYDAIDVKKEASLVQVRADLPVEESESLFRQLGSFGGRIPAIK